MRRVAVMLAVAAALAGLGRPGRGADIKDLVAGKMVPLTIQLKDLSGDWWRMIVGTQSETGGLGSFYAALMGGGGAGLGVYYTKGETVTLGSETYLVAYQVETKPLDYARMMESGPRPPKPEKLTAEAKLSVSLLNLRTIVSLSSIRPFDLEQEIAASEGVVKEESTAESVSNLKQIMLGLLMYAQDYDEVLPSLKDAAAVKKALKPYVRDEKLFTNPVTQKPYMANAVLSGKKLGHIEDPSAMVVFYEDSPAPDGTRGVAFLDGSAKRVTESEWETLKKASKIP